MFKTSHNLLFETATHPKHGNLFRIGTVEGQWGSLKNEYFILSVVNNEPGNGHLDDVFEWFEHSCKRDNRNLLVLECFNNEFYHHLIKKKGFRPLDNEEENVIKVFNKKAYRRLLKKGNEIMDTNLKCI